MKILFSRRLSMPTTSSDAAGQFELRKAKEQDGHFEVVGVAVRGQHDEFSSQQPILDLLITLTTERRSAEQTLVLICQKVSEQSKIPVTPARLAAILSSAERLPLAGSEWQLERCCRPHWHQREII